MDATSPAAPLLRTTDAAAAAAASMSETLPSARPLQVSEETAADSAQRGPKRATESSRASTRVSPAAAAAVAPPTTSTAAGTAPPHADSLAHIDLVVYASYEIRAQYASPYPLDELAGIVSPNSAASTAPSVSLRSGSGSGATLRAGAREDGSRSGKKRKMMTTTTTKVPRNGAAAAAAAAAGLSPWSAAEEGGGGSPGRVSPELAAPVSSYMAVEGAPLSFSSSSSVAQDGTATDAPVGTDGDAPLFATPSTVAVSPELAVPPEASFSFPTSIAETPIVSPPLETTLPPPSSSGPSHPPISEPSAAEEPVASTSSAPAVAAPPAAVAGATLSSPAAAAGGLQHNIPTSRGNRGRFLPKPPGETVKAKRAAERAARLAAGGTSTTADSGVHLTQRQQRELARKAREERDREWKEQQKLLPAQEVKLFVCDRCFKYMALPAAYLAHQRDCQVTRPPGRRVYQRGATSIWEVDGAQAKLYCQNLCLFAKLFIEHKYMFFDVESFTFYLLTEAQGKQEWVLGYFSKEKISYDDYNLACIVVFPPFRQRGWATLLIEFSYELSRRFSATPGTPERPLSELGQRGYLAVWISVLVRYFRAVFALRGRPPLIDEVMSAPVRQSMSPLRKSAAEGRGQDEAERERERERKKRLRRSKGWDGELPSGASVLATSPAKAFTLRPLPPMDPSTAVDDATTTAGSGPGGASVDIVDGEEVFSFATGLDELALAVNMRPDDVAYALVESGLARWRSSDVGEGHAGPEGEATNGSGAEREVNGIVTGEVVKVEDGHASGSAPVPALAAGATSTATIPARGAPLPREQERELELVITPELVEEVARQKGVKPMPMLDVAYVCDL